MPALDFQDALDRFGADLSRWPTAQRTLGEAMLRTEPSARAMLDEARRLRALLAGAPSHVSAPRGLADRIMKLAFAGDRALPLVGSPPTAADSEKVASDLSPSDVHSVR